MTNPVARMRSMTPKILRRYAPWVGSDRPTPLGSGVAPGGVGVFPMDEMSGVVAKEEMEETEDVLLMWGLKDIKPLEFRLDWLHFIDGDRQGQGSK
jgi:hypothetical protein